MIDYIKGKFIKLWNIVSGKDKNWDGSVDIKDKMIEYIKAKMNVLFNIISGKDKNWDGKVDIKDKFIEAENKSKK